MSKRVLIVDDQDEGVIYLEELIRSLGLEPLRAYRWKQALELLVELRETHEPLAMFLDLDLGITPNDGFILMDQMDAKQLYVPTQIVSYAADLIGDTAQLCARYAFARYIPIPKERVVAFRDFIIKFLGEARASSSTGVGASPRPYSEANNTDWKRRNVFVVYGRNQKIRLAMFAFLAAIQLNPIDFVKAVPMTGKTLPYVGEVLDVAFDKAQATIAIFTPDDEGRLRKMLRLPDDLGHESSLAGQPRLNVVLEAGMGLGRHQDRTIIVEVGKVRQFSDLLGRHTIRMDNSMGKRQALALRLQTAGCAVDLTGTDWHKAGDFSLE